MLHEPSTPVGKDPAGPYQARPGARMFAVCTLFYAALAAINLTPPRLMGVIGVAGLDLATAFGFLLLIGALVEALTCFDDLCQRTEVELAGGSTSADTPPATIARA